MTHTNNDSRKQELATQLLNVNMELEKLWTEEIGELYKVLFEQNKSIALTGDEPGGADFYLLQLAIVEAYEKWADSDFSAQDIADFVFAAREQESNVQAH